VASLAKVEIGVLGSGATLTACHIADLIALVICGPEAAVIVSAWSAWTQCTFRSKAPNPLHQTLFSVAALALSMGLAGLVYVLPRRIGRRRAAGYQADLPPPPLCFSSPTPA
jgi:hypothetical protein